VAEKIQFFPIDVTYKVENNKAVIYLFGRTIDGKQICVTDDSFKPYFYVIPKKGFEIQEKLEKLKVGEEPEISEIIKTETVSKKYSGKDVEAIRVFTKLPKDVPIIRDIIKKWDMIESINEYDILFIRRYLIDKNIVPLTLCQAEGEFVNLKSKVPVLKASLVEHFSDDALTKPRILAIDIETYNPMGHNVMPEKNPIIMVAFYGDNYKKVITWKRFKTSLDYIDFVASEEEVIKKIKEVFDEYKPDIVTGYFSDGFDFPYIKTRASKYKIKLDLGLDYSDLTISKSQTAKIKGIAHVDVFKFVRRVMRIDLDTEAYGLNSVASELLNEKKMEVDLDNLAHIWDNEPDKIEEFCKYNLHDATLTYKLCEKILPSIIEFVKIVGLPIYDINRMGFSQLVEWYLLKQAPHFNEIAPNKPHYDEVNARKMQTYRGAFVFEPEPGLYNDIVVFDFRSLYPTIISSHNISPATLNCECCEGKEIAPTEEKYWFCTKKKGFIPHMIEELITRRMRIKEMMKKEQNVFLEARQNSLKLLANSFYGYLGFYAARWYSLESAKSITAYGRFYIQKVINKAKAEAFKVLYSDTDSIFLSLDGKSKEGAERFAEAINVELPGLMELEYEGFYPSGIFVSAKIGAFGAKKKYALISEDGVIKIKGFETVRRNWSVIAKEVQENVLNIILKKGDKEKAFEYVKSTIHDLRAKKVHLDKVIITTQLQKEIVSYDAVGPHVAVAQKLKNKGVVVGPGSMISYIVTQGKDRIRDRAKLPDEVKADEYDAEYYINNQVIPAVEKIFEVIGYSKDDLTESKHQKKLDKFFS
jgi:DNA polymerase I